MKPTFIIRINLFFPFKKYFFLFHIFFLFFIFFCPMSETLFEKNMFVLLNRGRFAGNKGIIVDTDLENNRIIIAGVSKIPKNKKRKTIVFLKKMNPMHIMATTYKRDIGLSLDNLDSIFEDKVKKAVALNRVREIFNKNKNNEGFAWLYKKLEI
ncbi:60S ribosomal protein L27 [Spraguea lophii 42_110]|uniref:60S ribosomal protein L27 n=1 Tax=Spraguea lophii (strain 42_110) TaxID=1358809 RepID=S7XU08_SPRLO|nr:Chain LZ0, 60S ribosomal protein L27 [Spraguea lophii 42_110]7QJH_KZ0 Chain KZ0, 60S ribosomal protein L27 [Spraguea lophii 42_110]7QJH_LZ0 Chain LZ0, 60S ribosomal protein L27 [Spraguea lophii 42_110]8BR3_LZ0 Chain LZ0, 60S ribosomal protein L27 [Spraguea lophii 42_110]8P5D_LZ0 Chain LZ0, 60S ribosomal protein L27 [Spraguea lophii 42_110]8P60_KZ0 Chain KZ0, 60S ribosomal protein L27 [Spraguea lophii 42_110]8P60_LZ0 Chain LZ0, 60S ribosomal protein L27 [Spraguea lophii 42_110]EPR79388.1 6